jgi:hypothetical protein
MTVKKKAVKKKAVKKAAPKSKTHTTSTPEAKMLADLAKSGLTQADARKLKLQPMTEEQCTALKLSRDGEGYVIPYYSAEGELLPMFRFRYFDDSTKSKPGFLSKTKQRKYDQPRDTDAHIYLPQMVDWPTIQKDVKASLVITEGEKKAACATRHKYPCVGVGGVYSFGSRAKYQTLLPELEDFNWRGRHVFICYDSDAITNRKVLIAEDRLARALTDRGALVHIVRLPQEGNDKVGLDDYIVEAGIKAFEALCEATELWGDSRELHRLNTEVTYVDHPSMVVEFPREQHPPNQPRYRMMKVATFANERFANRIYFRLTADDKLQQRSAAKDWVQWAARAAVDSVVYEPAAEVIVNGSQLNLWEGWGATPIEGDVAPFVELFEHMFSTATADERKWLLQWMAYPLQNPGAKMNTAVIVWSLIQGSGKSLLGYTLMRIYGVNAAEVNKEQLQGSFNAWAINKQFVIGEEITGGSGREVADILKNMITGREVTVNAKYQPTYTIRNCINYYFTSNHQDAFFLTDKDRRYFIHEISVTNLSADFFKTYDDWYRSQVGIDALFYYLLQVDLAGFNPAAEAPHTASRKEMIEAGLAEHAAWCKELREHPDNILRMPSADGRVGMIIPFDLYTIDDLLAIYQPEDTRRTRRISPKGLSIVLKEAGFSKANAGQPVETGKGLRQHVWCIRNDEDALLGRSEVSEKYQTERSMKAPAKDRKFTKKSSEKTQVSKK